MRRTQLFHYFFLISFALLLYQLGMILSPFAASILGAIVLTVLFKPFHERLARTFPKTSENFRAALSTILITMSIIIPVLVAGWLIVNESEAIIPLITSWQDTLRGWQQGDMGPSAPLMTKIQTTIHRLLGLGPREVRAGVLQMAGNLFTMVNHAGQAIARNAVISIIQIAIMVFTLFFLLRDGKTIRQRVLRLIPMRTEHKEEISRRLHTALVEIIRGSLLTSIIQTVCASTGYFLAGLPASLSLGLLTGVAAFIPMIGSAIIWVPIGATLLIKGETGKGLFILAWGVLLVSVIDNLLRPFLIRDKAKLPVLFLFFGFLGGLSLYGAKGILLGPFVVVLVLEFADIYQEQYFRKGGSGTSPSPEAPAHHRP